MSFVPGIEPPEGWQGSAALYFVVHRKGVVVRRDRGGGARLLTEDEARVVMAAPPSVPHFLGRVERLDGVANVFAVAAAATVAAPFAIENLRGLYGEISEVELAIASRALQIVDWASTHRFCGRCATATERSTSERVMRCPACGLSVYPRISPAIIVLVRKGDLALLAHGARFPLPFYSTLAGFVEAGESLEECLVREVKEEVGIDVGDLRYFGSQSWPFPNSLMLGFFATWKSGDIVIDPTEIVDARWFRADELPMVPPPLTISRQLIDVWLAEVKKEAARERDG